MMNPLSEDTQNLLSTVPLFKGLSKSELGWIYQRVRRRVFPAMTNILLADQPGEAVYIILFGTVKIFIVSFCNGNPLFLFRKVIAGCQHSCHYQNNIYLSGIQHLFYR